MAENADPILLGAYAAKQCPYRLFREHDPTEPAVPAPPDEALQQLFDDGIAFEAAVVERILSIHGSDAVAIPGRDDADHDDRRALTDDALAVGTPIVLGALMQPDVTGRRLAEIDILVATGTSTDAGKAEYRPIDVKSHRCTIDLADPADVADPLGVVHDLRLIGDPDAVPGLAPRYREDDCLQLVHYHRLLQAHGLAAPDGAGRVWGAILGRECLIAWFDLTRPQFTTLTPQERQQTHGDEPTIAFHRRSHSTKRSAIDRYDFEFDFRLRVVDTASRRTDRDDPPMVLPVSIAECERCPWYEPCHVDMAAVDDVSLVKPVGYPEWRVHRFLGRPTAHELADLDLATARAMLRAKPVELLDARAWASTSTPDAGVGATEWPHLADHGFSTAADLRTLDPVTLTYATTPITATSLVKQIECARSAIAGRPVVVPGWDDGEIPRGDVEIDLDLENAEYVYLWGARLSVVPDHWPEQRASYVSFASFEPLADDDPDGTRVEARVVADLWDWLSDIRGRADAEGLTVLIYGYSSIGVEGGNLVRIAAGSAHHRLPDVDRVAELVGSDEWIDLLPYMRRKFWSNWGHGLKVIARASGFAWRDDDPGGFTSIGWYRDAIAGIDREAAIDRILSYNEDDCAATAALRTDSSGV